VDQEKAANEVKELFKKTFLPDAIDLKYYDQLNSWVIFVDRKTLDSDVVTSWLLKRYQDFKETNVDVKFVSYRSSQLKRLLGHKFEEYEMKSTIESGYDDYNYTSSKSNVDQEGFAGYNILDMWVAA